jgi:acyl-CoA thioesterase FadM
MTFVQDIHFATQPEKIITKGQVVIVCIDEKIKPRALPQLFVEKLT